MLFAPSCSVLRSHAVLSAGTAEQSPSGGLSATATPGVYHFTMDTSGLRDGHVYALCVDADTDGTEGLEYIDSGIRVWVPAGHAAVLHETDGQNTVDAAEYSVHKTADHAKHSRNTGTTPENTLTLPQHTRGYRSPGSRGADDGRGSTAGDEEHVRGERGHLRGRGGGAVLRRERKASGPPGAARH